MEKLKKSKFQKKNGKLKKMKNWNLPRIPCISLLPSLKVASEHSQNSHKAVRAVSKQCQSKFRTVAQQSQSSRSADSVQSQSKRKAVARQSQSMSEHSHSNLKAIPVPSRFNAIFKHSQRSRKAVSEQAQSIQQSPSSLRALSSEQS